MAFSSVANRGSASEKVSDTSISMSPSANLTVGKLVFVHFATDNDATATADGASTRHTQVQDTQGHTWTKVAEYTDADGSAGTGVTHSLWYAVITTQITTANSITATCSSAVTNKIISCCEVSKTPNSTIAIAQTGLGQSAISASVSSLSSREYYLIGWGASEGNDNTKTPDADYTEMADVRTGSGTADTEICTHVQVRIATLTGDTCTSTGWTNTNPVMALTAVYEVFPAMDTLKDNFDDNSIDTSKWSTTGAFISETSQQIQIVTQTTPAYSGLISVGRFDLTGSYNVINIVDAGNQAFTSLEAYGADLLLDDNNKLQYLISRGSIQAYKVVATVSTHIAGDLTYNAAVHKWLRVRESGGTIFFDYSTDGITWTNQNSTTVTYDIRAMQVRITGGNYGAEASTSTIKYDNYNLPISVTPQTVTGLSRILKVVGQTIIGIGDIKKAVNSTISGLARIESGGVVNQNIDGKGRIQDLIQSDVSGKGRVLKVVGSSILGIGRIQKVVGSNIVGIGRIRDLLSVDIQGKGRVQLINSGSVQGLGRIKVLVNSVVNGKGRVQKFVSQTVLGIGRVQKSVISTIVGVGRVKTVQNQIVEGLGRISVIVNSAISGLGRILINSSGLILGKGRVLKVIQNSILGKGRVEKSSSENISGKGRVEVQLNQSLIGKGSIYRINDYQLLGKGRVEKIGVVEILGKGKIVSGLNKKVEVEVSINGIQVRGANNEGGNILVSKNGVTVGVSVERKEIGGENGGGSVGVSVL